MAEAPTNWIDFLVSLSPVAQTGVWAGISLVALVTLRKPVEQLVNELVRRVNQGDKISTPWLSLEKEQDRERKVVEQVTKNIRAEFLTESGLDDEPSPKLSKTELNTLLDDVSDRFIELVFPPSEFQSARAREARTSLYMTGWETVSDFLNDAYLTASDLAIEIPVWSYGKYWRLRNQRTDKPIIKKSSGTQLDNRPFEAIDLKPGDVLVAERIR